MTSESLAEKRTRPGRPLLFISLSALLLLLGIVGSLKWGQAPVSWHGLLGALVGPGDGKTDLYVRLLRLPRALTACMAGAQLALAGLLTQLATRNPLASPHLFGVNAGASFFVVIGLVAIPDFSAPLAVGLAFAGAAAGAILVWSLAGGGRFSPVQLALAGITVHFLLSALTEGMMVLNQQSTDSMIFWLVGSVSQASWQDVRLLSPFLGSSLIFLFALLPSLRLLAVEDEIASGLGQRVAAVRTAAFVLVLLLAGSAVALCGPIGFLCLIVPHISRALVGGKLGALVPMTALLGGALLVCADLASRFIAFPFESPVGIVTSALGAPLFLHLARRRGGTVR
ncbi:FecCD family ABC transporter permease [Cohnella zeiphila]|uniref:Iron ABC transporter permease n=1 Tax=Cohnella zeiphila TaxID=2761120 RepID=A0A7X0SLV0_9BACL|nr:iron ABC transporter permease [Cohnella zeiphila]MBB6731070.1 iron ABC transporter permease [Cohnella zeiphila]